VAADNEISGFTVRGYGLVYADYDRAADETTLIQPVCSTGGACVLVLNPDEDVFGGAGHVEGLSVSPDGRWLVSGWPLADQLLFLRLPPGPRIRAVDDVRREFDPGRPPSGELPRLAGWSASPPGA
jgi:hypothetical protein